MKVIDIQLASKAPCSLVVKNINGFKIFDDVGGYDDIPLHTEYIVMCNGQNLCVAGKNELERIKQIVEETN